MNGKQISDEQLIAFAAGDLAPDAADAVRRHIRRDAEAAQLVERYREISRTAQEAMSVNVSEDVVAKAKQVFNAQELPQVESLWDRLKQTIAQVVFDSRSQASLVGVRGPGGGFQVSYQTESLDIDIQAEPAGATVSIDTPAQSWNVIGQVMAREDLTIEQARLLSTIDPSQPELDIEVSDRGVFRINASPGTYDLQFMSGDEVITLSGITIP